MLNEHECEKMKQAEINQTIQKKKAIKFIVYNKQKHVPIMSDLTCYDIQNELISLT